MVLFRLPRSVVRWSLCFLFEGRLVGRPAVVIAHGVDRNKKGDHVATLFLYYIDRVLNLFDRILNLIYFVIDYIVFIFMNGA